MTNPEPNFIYDPDDWECTYEWPQHKSELMEGRDLDPADVKRFCTLINGPDKFAARVVLTRDDDGEPDETEIQWFDTEAEARIACGLPPYITGG